MMRVSILIAEDDALLHSLLADILDREGDLEVVGVAEDGNTCLEVIERLHPMVVLLDLRLRGLSGQKVLSHLLEQPEPPAVLVLSGEDDENTQVEVARSGARGFLPKREAVAVLARAIRAVSKGESWFTPEVTARILREHQDLVRKVRDEQRPLNHLTVREREVLARVARGLTNRQIAAELFMSVHTVKLHIANILRKLGLPNRTEAAVFAVREGLIEDGAAPSAA